MTTERKDRLPGRSERLYRDIEFERAEDGALTTDLTGRYGVCLSSESPVDRWFGREILAHEPGAINLGRFKKGLPLLVNHNTDDQVGIIEDPVLGEDRKLRGMARFGQSARAKEIEQDVKDGIRREMSIGYSIQKMQMTESDKELGDTFRATAWTPLEGSIVPVPADTEVGVGRSGEESALPAVVEALPSAPPEAAQEEVRMADVPAAPEGAKVTIGAEYGEAAEIARMATENGFTDRIAGWLDRKASAKEVGAEILKALHEKAERTITAGGMGKEMGPDLSKKEEERYSLVRAIVRMAEGKRDGLEFEVSNEMRKQYRGEGLTDHDGLLVPYKMMNTRAQPPLVAGTASVGGNIVFTEPQSFIELLRNQMVINDAGARTLTGLQGPIAFPRQKTAGTASWGAEAASVASSYLTLDQLTMAPSELKSWTSYSRRLLVQSTPDVDNIVRADLAMIHAIAIDYAAMYGTGSSQPTGVVSVSGIGSVVTGATNGVAPTYDTIVGLEGAVDKANALRGALAYITTPYVKQALKLTAKLTNTIASPVWETDGTMNGYRALSTNQLPHNLTKGTATTVCSAILFGNWQELFVGFWGGFEIITDPYSLADSGQIKLATFQLADVGVRHAASFAACLDAVAT